MDRTAVYRRLVRRETHSSRSVAAVFVAAVIAVALFVLLGLSAWAAFDAGFRDAATTWITDTVAGLDAESTLTVVGIVALILAVMLFLIALTPGRRARHARVTDRIALVVDDGVLADAAADAVTRQCALARNQVSTTMTRRALTVRVTPTSGLGVNGDRVKAAALAAVSGAGFDKEANVDIAQRGVIA
ncbi:hypothetical protein [Microbacterium sp. A93]|uniref:hypothetical protein n=1 Tax=Microbacterium sp. A93 TaxID=3450716 RepID=UPI003F43640A